MSCANRPFVCSFFLFFFFSGLLLLRRRRPPSSKTCLCVCVCVRCALETRSSLFFLLFFPLPRRACCAFSPLCSPCYDATRDRHGGHSGVMAQHSQAFFRCARLFFYFHCHALSPHLVMRLIVTLLRRCLLSPAPARSYVCVCASPFAYLPVVRECARSAHLPLLASLLSWRAVMSLLLPPHSLRAYLLGATSFSWS